MRRQHSPCSRCQSCCEGAPAPPLSDRHYADACLVEVDVADS